MGNLTEIETFDCLTSNLRGAIDSCDKLAKSRRRGPLYSAFREHLGLIEGSSRQIAYMRGGDARWLRVANAVAGAHAECGEWLRGIKVPGGPRIKLAEGHIHPKFIWLGEFMRELYKISDGLRTKATGKIGTILPETSRAPHRDTVPVGWRNHGGLIVPAGVTVQ